MSRRWFVLVSATAILGGCAPKAETPSSGPTAPATGKAKATRVAVKHATDPEAASINLTAQKASLSDLLKMKRPAGLKDDLSGDEYQAKRVAPFETSTYEVDANVKSIVLRKDGDYYVVIEDDGGRQSVVEVPDPSQCKGSPLEGQIASARKDLEERYHPTTVAKEINERATINGVGFFGNIGKNGKGPSNGARLMPGLGFKFKKG